jgi:hypothetical protein
MKKIAIIVFIPNKDYLIQQFFSLYYSVMLHPVLRKKTDFIIGCSAEITGLFNLENCVVVHSNEISMEAKYKFPYSDNEYGYINSWSHFIDQNSIDVILSYPYALRIDVDTFLSPNILNIDLADNEILVGKGGYIGGDETTSNLLRISETLDLNHRNLHNLGSTWLSQSNIMIEVGQAALECARYIINNEFIEDEGEWPRWYAGVSLLYAGELALNHSPYEITQTDKLDSESTNNKNIDDVFSIHAWHTDNFYSKYAFMNGEYQDRSHRYDMRRSQDYAFLCAHSGKLLCDSIQNSLVTTSITAENLAADAIVLTPLQALRISGNLLLQALPKAPMYIARRLKQKIMNRT